MSAAEVPAAPLAVNSAGDYPSSVSVAIVGGGVAGCSIAWQLARRGVDVALFEQEHLAWGASGRNGAHVGVETNYGSGVTAHRVRSLEIFRELEREVGDFRFDQCGRLRLFMGEEGEHEIPSPAEVHAAGPHTAGDYLMTGDEARVFFPYLSEHVVAAEWVATGGRVWPFQLVHRYAEGALRHGARIYIGAQVERLVIADRRAQGVVVDGRLVKADWVVNATNAWSGPLAETAGLRLPVLPWRGQIVVTQPVPELMTFTMGHFVHHGSNYWQQTRDGKFVIGGSRVLDVQGRGNLHDRQVAPDVQHATLAMVTKALPVLGRLRILRAWAGTMGFTPDGNPFVGETELRRGLVLACGFNGDGLSWSPVVGELLAQHIAGQPLTLPLDPIHPDRETGQLGELA
jgi:sarcosine oxidase subunit beta